MTLSLYAQYVKEFQGRGIVEIPEGFATFDYVGEDIVYIVDIYVVPEHRQQRIASKLADIIVEEAVKAGKKTLMGSVDVGLKTAERNCKVLEGYGMTIYKVVEPMIFYTKPIGESE